MLKPLDGIISLDPLIVRRTVRWGDCDPAKIVYTAQFAHYAIDAILGFLDEVIGKHPWRHDGPGGLGFPMKALSLEFVKWMVVGDQFEMTVHLGEVRTRTFALDVVAHCRGEVIFRAKATPILTNFSIGAAVPLTDELRAILSGYAMRNPSPTPAR